MLNKRSVIGCLMVEGYLKDSIYPHDLMDKPFFAELLDVKKLYTFLKQ